MRWFRGAPEEEAETGLKQGPLLMAAQYILLILFGLFFVLPLVWMIVTAFKPSTE